MCILIKAPLPKKKPIFLVNRMHCVLKRLHIYVMSFWNFNKTYQFIYNQLRQVLTTYTPLESILYLFILLTLDYQNLEKTYVVLKQCSGISQKGWAPHVGPTMGPTPFVRAQSIALGLCKNCLYMYWRCTHL